MSVDWTGWKIGDKGVIEVEFTFAGGHPDEVALDLCDNEIFLGSSDEIKSVTRIVQPLKVGDRVRYRPSGSPAVVLGVDGDDVWLRWSRAVGKGHAILTSSQLELVR